MSEGDHQQARGRLGSPTTAGRATVWPPAVPDFAEALRGPEGPGTLRSAAEALRDDLTPLERSVLRGAGAPVDAELVRRVVSCRFWLAASLALPPAEGARADAATAGRFLAEVDLILAALPRAAPAMPTALGDSLEAMRAALARSAVAFSERLQRLSDATESGAARKAAARRGGSARLLSIGSGQPSRLRLSALWVVLALLALASGGLRLHLALRQPAPSGEVEGAPSGTVAVAVTDRFQLLVAPDGRPLDPDEVKRFAAQAQARGLRVREIAPGQLIVQPEATPAPGR